MTADLESEQIAVVTMLLQRGKTIKEIAKFADLDLSAVTKLARTLDIAPTTPAQRRGKELFASPRGITYQEISKTLASEGFTGDEGAPMHHLTVASWVRNFGWAWGGSESGEYAPERSATASARSRYVLRLSKSLDAKVNAAPLVERAAQVAWQELVEEKTTIVQLAIVRGAAEVGVTDLASVKKFLFQLHGEEIRTARS